MLAQREVPEVGWRVAPGRGLDTSVPDLATSVKIRPSKPTGPASVSSLFGYLVLSLSSHNKPPLHDNNKALDCMYYAVPRTRVGT